jgi:hypothetical protein
MENKDPLVEKLSRLNVSEHDANYVHLAEKILESDVRSR